MSRQVFSKTTGGLCLIILAGFLGACNQKAPEQQNASPEPVSAAADNTTAVTIESGKGSVEITNAVKPWPDDAPADVPKYLYGTIRKIIRTETPEGNSWDMAIDRLPQHALRDYEAALKAKGFETTSMIVPEKEGDRGSVTGIKGAFTVVLIGSGGSMSLSIIQKQ
ncbi:hypothetical protein NY406_10990 [Chlorobaculum sp. MV4-Y]|uniref:hypothetical protein n=1 Tax=Chlorobaculum sp. MV4-Y TaxID=2976335 RepID=UPI0021AE5603|nr:hypothetical protein [Chlorobaculum sp. MV4-Y]UWX57694.1 hypothetical protein NY406_10990 [Chlorobaculum sp. MV4-Y]